MGNLLEALEPEAELLPVKDDDTDQDAFDALDYCVVCGHLPCDCDEQYDRWKEERLD